MEVLTNIKQDLLWKVLDKKNVLIILTYSPVTKITSIRMLIALASVYGLEIHQMDVKTIFLNEEMEEEIYMDL